MTSDETPPPDEPIQPEADVRRARLLRLEGGLLVEAVLIVLSILLAFAIEAAWDGRNERMQEVDLLRGLRNDFIENQDRLASNREAHEAQRQAALEFLEYARPGGTPEVATIPDEILIQMVVWQTYDPVVGTLNSAIASGQLGLIERDDLRSELAAWIDRVEDLNEEQLADRGHADAFARAAFDFVSFRSVSYRLGTGELERESTHPGDYRGLLTSLELENWATARVAEIGFVLGEIDEVGASLDQILHLIDEELGDDALRTGPRNE